jgi:hypothetical protein
MEKEVRTMISKILLIRLIQELRDKADLTRNSQTALLLELSKDVNWEAYWRLNGKREGLEEAAFDLESLMGKLVGSDC